MHSALNTTSMSFYLIRTADKTSLKQKQLTFSFTIKSIHSFVDISPCYEYIQKTTDLRIFLVVCAFIGETFLPKIHDLPQLQYVYVFCNQNAAKYEVWSRNFNKIRGVFDDDTHLMTCLKDDVRSLSKITFPFGLFSPAQRSLQDLNDDQASFMWFQLLIKVLIHLPQAPEAKAEMIAECCAKYSNNEKQLKEVMNFEKTYQSSEAIKWYTSDTFIYRLFNEAFREQNFKVIFKYRFFLVDLFYQLASLFTKQYKGKHGSLTVYRGQRMFKDELMKVEQSLGHLISVNTFLSTSSNCAVAQLFSGNGEGQTIGIESVIFEINIDFSSARLPFACVQELSSVKDETELLFSIGTVFCIESVELVTDTIWMVKLVLTATINEQLSNLLDFYTNNHIGHRSSVLVFGMFLSKMGLLRQALHFYNYVRKILPLDHPDWGILYNNLGEVLRKLGYINLARYQFDKALDCCTDTMTIFHPILAIIHNNIGLINILCEQYAQAITHLRCALLILRKSHISKNQHRFIDMQEVFASIYHSMGVAHQRLGQFQLALEFHCKALKIEECILPSGHPTLVDSYAEVGKVNINLNGYKEALKYYEKAFVIAQQSLHNSDWRFIPLHVNIGMLLYAVHRDMSKALIHCSEAQLRLDQLQLASSNPAVLEAYKILACFYLRLGLGPLAHRMCEKFIKVTRVSDSGSKDVDMFEIIKQVDNICRKNPNDLFKCVIFTNYEHLPNSNFPESEAILRCEIADGYRKEGYIQQAIAYYTSLLEQVSDPIDTRFSLLHKSRLHNNLATCYQDLENDAKALHHYQLSLAALPVDSDCNMMQAAIIHYNIALVYKNLNYLEEALTHLQKSLQLCLESPMEDDVALETQIYTAIARTYERSDNWSMACDYHQRALQKCLRDVPGHNVVEKYKKWLQNAINKVNEIS